MDAIEVLKIAEADLRRRLEQMSPQVDAQIEETLKIAERELARREGESLHWDAEFNFWHKIIGGEVARLRFNEGFEPIQVDLYPARLKSGPAFMGKTQVGHVHFRVEGKWQYDQSGNKVLRVTILKEP